MFTIGSTLLLTLLFQAWATYLGLTALDTLQSAPETPTRIANAVPALMGLVSVTGMVVAIASAWGLWRLR